MWKYLLVLYSLRLIMYRSFFKRKFYFNIFRQFLSRTLFLLIQNENEMKHFFVVELDVWKFPPRQLLYLLLNFHDHNFQ
jgi:hypothetical protein